MTELDIEAVRARAEAARNRFDTGRDSARLYDASARDVPALLVEVHRLGQEKADLESAIASTRALANATMTEIRHALLDALSEPDDGVTAVGAYARRLADISADQRAAIGRLKSQLRGFQGAGVPAEAERSTLTYATVEETPPR